MHGATAHATSCICYDLVASHSRSPHIESLTTCARLRRWSLTGTVPCQKVANRRPHSLLWPLAVLLLRKGIICPPWTAVFLAQDVFFEYSRRQSEAKDRLKRTKASFRQKSFCPSVTLPISSLNCSNCRLIQVRVCTYTQHPLAAIGA